MSRLGGGSGDLFVVANLHPLRSRLLQLFLGFLNLVLALLEQFLLLEILDVGALQLASELLCDILDLLYLHLGVRVVSVCCCCYCY